jgi:transposase InsO family protein
MTVSDGGYRSHCFQFARRQVQKRDVWTRPYQSQTTYRAKRFIRTRLAGRAYATASCSSRKRAAALMDWLRYRSTERPHTALGMRIPSERMAAQK